MAIDISIWQFQIRAAQGGTNPALRTFFYRLTRLLTLAIHPLFVFDGPKRPEWKRNKLTRGLNGGDRVGTAMAKRLINLFGFPIHDAPGEAEAECALLQRHGIVDAVLSEDVDTIMFGCTRTIRNWSAEGRGNVPTHVNLYDSEKLEIGREGMVLIALMSGGDYITEGISGCGVKVAYEAARARFGDLLCKIKASEAAERQGDAFKEWRTYLQNELATNKSKFFRTKHRALRIPEDFPNIEVLRYYTHPVVSPAFVLEKLKKGISWNRPVNVVKLREFVKETFDWNFRGGAIKFVKVFAPGILVKKLLAIGDTWTGSVTDLVMSIKNERAHVSTDFTPEVRITYIPAEVVCYNPYKEEEETVESSRAGLALNSDDELDETVEGDKTKVSAKQFQAMDQNMIWIPECILARAAPEMLEGWKKFKEQSRSGKTKRIRQINAQKKVDIGPINGWVRTISEPKIGNPINEAGKEAPPTVRIRPERKRASISLTSTRFDPWRLAGSSNIPTITKSAVADFRTIKEATSDLSLNPVIHIPSSPESILVCGQHNMEIEASKVNSKTFEKTPYVQANPNPRKYEVDQSVVKTVSAQARITAFLSTKAQSGVEFEMAKSQSSTGFLQSKKEANYNLDQLILQHVPETNSQYQRIDDSLSSPSPKLPSLLPIRWDLDKSQAKLAEPYHPCTSYSSKIEKKKLSLNTNQGEDEDELPSLVNTRRTKHAGQKQDFASAFGRLDVENKEREKSSPQYDSNVIAITDTSDEDKNEILTVSKQVQTNATSQADQADTKTRQPEKQCNQTRMNNQQGEWASKDTIEMTNGGKKLDPVNIDLETRVSNTILARRSKLKHIVTTESKAIEPRATIEVRKTKLFVPSLYRNGFLEVIEVHADRAEEEKRLIEAAEEEINVAASSRVGTARRKVWRQSDIDFVDLTGE